MKTTTEKFFRLDDFSIPLAILFIAMMVQTTLISKATLMIAIVTVLYLNFRNNLYKSNFITLKQCLQVSGLIGLHILSVASLFGLYPLLKKLGLIVSPLFANHASLICNETGFVCLQFTNQAKATFYSALPLPPSCIGFFGQSIYKHAAKVSE